MLDFARPIRFDLAPADVNEICRSARDAVRAAAPTPDVALELDPGCGTLTTDAERVRTVLVNLLDQCPRPRSPTPATATARRWC